MSESEFENWLQAIDPDLGIHRYNNLHEYVDVLSIVSAFPDDKTVLLVAYWEDNYEEWYYYYLTLTKTLDEVLKARKLDKIDISLEIKSKLRAIEILTE